MTEAQFRLFSQPERKPGQRLRRPPEQWPENILESQIVGFLRVRGWIVDRQQSGLFIPFWNPKRRVRVGEKGCFDWVVLRSGVLMDRSNWANIFYLETKAPGKKLDTHQIVWARRRRAAGFLCVWFDDFDRFKDWYKENFG